MQLFEKTLGDFLEYWAEKTPDKEFIVYSDRDLRFTYSEFNKRVNNLAKGMMAIGVEKDSKVGIWATNVPDWLTFLFASAKIGAILVTVNTNYKQHELEYLVENADIHTLCISNGTFDSDYVDMTYTMLPELKTSQRGHLKSNKFPYMRNVVYIGQEKHRGMYNTAELLLLGNTITDEKLEVQKQKFNCYDVVNMQYTSGTTGFPKGVMLTSRNILNDGYYIGENMNFSEEDRLCIQVPLFHCFGSVLGVMAVITHGSTIVMLEEFDPLLALSAIQKEKCTAIHGVPTMFIAKLTHPMFDMFDMSSLRTGIMAGSTCPVETMKEVIDKMNMTEITSVYGLTEASPGMTQTNAADTFEKKVNTVGTPFPNVEVKLIDPDTGEDITEVGKKGEIVCRGFNVMKGYYKNPEKTKEVIEDDGFLHSGDLATIDEDGYYSIVGRIKDMIIRGGENIYPREIEEFIYTIDGVQDVQVAGIPDEKYGEIVGAFIIKEEGSDLTEEDVRDYAISKIARYKVPKHVFFVDEFPLTTSGKIQKYKLGDIGLELLKKREN